MCSTSKLFSSALSFTCVGKNKKQLHFNVFSPPNLKYFAAEEIWCLKMSGQSQLPIFTVKCARRWRWFEDLNASKCILAVVKTVYSHLWKLGFATSFLCLCLARRVQEGFRIHRFSKVTIYALASVLNVFLQDLFDFFFYWSTCCDLSLKNNTVSKPLNSFL